MGREQRSQRPGDRRQHDRGQPERIEGAGAAERRRTDEERDADEPDGDADHRERAAVARRGTMRPKIATQTGIIAMSSAVIPDGMVCSPNATMPMPPPSSRPPTMSESRHSRRVGATKRAAIARERPEQQDRTGDAEADRGHEERRDRLDRDRDPEVGRAPDDVEDEHAQPEPHASSGARRWSRWHRWVVQDRPSVRWAPWPSPLGQPDRNHQAAMAAAPDAGRQTLHGAIAGGGGIRERAERPTVALQHVAAACGTSASRRCASRRSR